MAIKMNGTQSPAEAIREEINRLRGEQNQQEDTTGDTDIDESHEDADNESLDDSFFTDVSESNASTDTTPTPKEQTAEYWKARFDVMQGKYNAELPRKDVEVNLLRERVAFLEQAQTKAPTTSGNVDDILDDLEEQYGSEFTKAVDARVSKIVKEQVGSIVNEFKNDISSIKETQHITDTQLFEDAISEVAPKWRVLNVDPSFISWVQNSTESFSGVTLQKILIDAYTSRDVAKLAKIFNTYEKLKNKQTDTTTQRGNDASILTAPPKRGSTTGTTIENNSGKVFTMSQVNDFYAKLTAGKYKGKDAWVRTMKEEISLANREGRIV